MRGAELTRPHFPRSLAGRDDECIALRSLAMAVRDGVIGQSTSAGRNTKLQTALFILKQVVYG